MSYICADWSCLLAGMFNEILYEVGLGRRRGVYHKACQIWLQSQKIPFVSRPPTPVALNGIHPEILSPDFLVWETLPVALRATPRSLDVADRYPLLDWMKASTCPMGLLVNMGQDQVEQHRVTYESVSVPFEQDWTYWSDIEGPVRTIGMQIRSAVQMVYDLHGTGYGDRICGRLVECAMRQHGMSIAARPEAKAWFRGILVDRSQLDCFIVNNCFLVVVTARTENIYSCVNRTISYLRSVGLEWGVAVNFGLDKVNIVGLRKANIV